MVERSLEAELETMRQRAAERATPERAALQAAAIAEIETLVAGRALKVGAQAPLFTLPGAADGRDISLSELLGDGPVVLSFYRGQWCPYCNIELRAFEQRYDEFRALGASVLFVGPETKDKAAMMVEKAETRIPVLYDIDGAVMDAYQLTFEVPELLRPSYERLGLNPGTGWKLPVPATYLIGQDGIIQAGAANPDYRYRMDPEDVLSALREQTGTDAAR